MDYLKLNNRQYAVSHCFAAMTMFAEMSGKRTLEQMADLGEMTPNELLTMMYCAMYMGEKAEGRELDVENPQALGLLVGIGDVQEYVQIFAKQMKADIPAQKKSANEVKKKIPFWRRLKG